MVKFACLKYAKGWNGNHTKVFKRMQICLPSSAFAINSIISEVFNIKISDIAYLIKIIVI